MREKKKQKIKQNMKLGNTPQEQKQLATPGIEFLQIKKALDFVHLQVGRPC